MSKNIELDKFYTSVKTAKECVNLMLKTLENKLEITEFLEPSAGSGNFSDLLDCIAYDIKPQGNNIIEADFLELDLNYKIGRVIFGNPPFGDRNNLATRFFKKSIKISDAVSFILPISQLNNTDSFYEFDLLKSIDLGILKYSGMEVHCCFNIYLKPKNGFNKKPNYKVDIFDLYRTGDMGFDNIKSDFMFCKRGSVGKEIDENGKRYGDEYKVVVKDKSNLAVIKEKILNFNWLTYKKHQSSPNISKNDVYRLFN